MYDQILKQTESLFKPMSDLIELNTQTFETLRTKQTDLMNEVLADSLEYAKGMATPSMDIDNVIESQQAYWQTLQTKLTNNAQDNYELLNSTQGKVGELLQNALAGVGVVGSTSTASEAKTASASAEVKAKAPAKKKPVAKKAPKATVKATKADAAE